MNSIKEIARVLKSGGLFINANKMVHDNEEEHREAYNEQIRRFGVYDSIGKSDLRREWVEHYAVDDSENIRLVEGEFIRKLEEAEFSKVRSTWRELLETVVVARKS